MTLYARLAAVLDNKEREALEADRAAWDGFRVLGDESLLPVASGGTCTVPTTAGQVRLTFAGVTQRAGDRIVCTWRVSEVIGVARRNNNERELEHLFGTLFADGSASLFRAVGGPAKHDCTWGSFADAMRVVRLRRTGRP